MSIERVNDTDSYLGDGVYAHFDGYHVVLRTERDDGIHWIALEPSVLDSLNIYANRIKETT